MRGFLVSGFEFAGTVFYCATCRCPRCQALRREPVYTGPEGYDVDVLP